MEQRVSLITLGVADVEASAAFYERLGWRRSSAGQAGEVAFFAAGTVLALWRRAALAEDAGLPDTGPGNAVALAYNARSREEVAAVLAEAVAAGARLVRAAAAADWGGYTGYFADPDGHLWEVAYNPAWPLGPDGRVLLPE